MSWLVGLSSGCVCGRGGGRLPSCQNLGMSLGSIYIYIYLYILTTARNVTKIFAYVLLNLKIISFVLGVT